MPGETFRNPLGHWRAALDAAIHREISFATPLDHQQYPIPHHAATRGTVEDGINLRRSIGIMDLGHD